MKPIKLTLLALLLSIPSFAQIAAITGPSGICDGSAVAYTDATPGGTWSSSAPSIAVIGSTSGIATGISVGALTLTYTVGLSYVTYPITVNPLPAPITGPASVCVGSTITISDITPGGTWSSSNPAIGSVTFTGAVIGSSPGTTTISYTN